MRCLIMCHCLNCHGLGCLVASFNFYLVAAIVIATTKLSKELVTYQHIPVVLSVSFH